MKYCEDLDDVSATTVDDAVRGANELTEIRPLRNGSSGIGKSSQLIYGQVETLDDGACVRWRVSADEFFDGREVVCRLLGPTDFRHKPRRRFTSSWLTVFPPSASCKPRSIFERK